MRNSERADLKVADTKSLASFDFLKTLDTFTESFRKNSIERIQRAFGYVQRRLPHAQHLRQAVAVINMFVGDENAVDVVDVFFDGRQPRQRFAFAEAAINDESGAFGLEQGNVARAA